MALFDKLKTGLLGLKGQPGPNFENEGQRTSSNIQALAKSNALVSSQDLISGRFYGQASNRVKVAPSQLDLNGEAPLAYTQRLGSTNSGNQTPFNSSTGTGFTLSKRLPFSQLGLQGKAQPEFESVSQMTTSDIQARAQNNVLQASQDLLTGRRYGKGRFTVFVPASQPPISVPDAFAGRPFYPTLGGVYKSKGPKEGRY
jgi:hypothetical protein